MGKQGYKRRVKLRRKMREAAKPPAPRGDAPVGDSPPRAVIHKTPAIYQSSIAATELFTEWQKTYTHPLAEVSEGVRYL